MCDSYMVLVIYFLGNLYKYIYGEVGIYKVIC